MTITAAALYANARSRLGLNFSDSRLDDNNVAGFNAAINAGISDLCAAHDWDWLYAETTIPVVAGTESYNLPTRHLRTLWVANDTNTELTLRQRRDAIKYAGQTGYPYFYSVLNDKMYLTPVPDSAATFRHGYYAYLAQIDAANITALSSITYAIPDMYVALAALYIGKNIAMMFKDYDAYNMMNTEIKAELDRVADNTRRSIGPVAPQVRSW